MKRLGGAVAAAAILVGCRDLSSFSTHGDSFTGDVVGGSAWSAGIADGTKLCLTLDADHFQDRPGLVSTSDGRFEATPLRPVPQLWRDPLSTLSFGEGRLKNLIYVASPVPSPSAGASPDVLMVISLMQSGGVEARLLQGAPPLVAEDADAAAISGGDAAAVSVSDAAVGGPLPANLFAVFVLTRQKGPCLF